MNTWQARHEIKPALEYASGMQSILNSLHIMQQVTPPIQVKVQIFSVMKKMLEWLSWGIVASAEHVIIFRNKTEMPVPKKQLHLKFFNFLCFNSGVKSSNF